MPHFHALFLSCCRRRHRPAKAAAAAAVPTILILRCLNTDGPKFDRWPQELDYGIYFFSADNIPRKIVPGQANEFFHPDRPTIIYFHGWQLDAIRRHFRESFDYHANNADACPEQMLESTYWVQKGWNIGIFYWDQFADEWLVGDAEAKIWSSMGNAGMRYRTSTSHWLLDSIGMPSSTVVDGIENGTCVTDLFVTEFVNLARANRGHAPRELRFAGGSLGVQLAVHTAAKLWERAARGTVDSSWLPSRIALLDPYFSPKVPLVNSQSYLPDDLSTASAVLLDVASLAEKGVVFELHVTSDIADVQNRYTNRTAYDALRKYAVYVRRYPLYCDGRKGLLQTMASHVQKHFDLSDLAETFVGKAAKHFADIWFAQSCQHSAAWNLYFLEKGFQPPPLCSAPSSEQGRSCTTPSSSCTDVGLQRLSVAARSRHLHFVQAGGMHTIAIDDDCFELRLDSESLPKIQAEAAWNGLAEDTDMWNRSDSILVVLTGISAALVGLVIVNSFMVSRRRLFLTAGEGPLLAARC
eukprot:gnl/TRDRNA2_/TRDRNA2_41748_c0_seq1.p1 gnl/TRDRNA2_/TRDRNA2_41748_c0~~gnl/TRDRNA2_/TRDRNA2_41748_c0_seq1.p1  ORF type:complete len:525 (-),score=75.85 gnl/TRDRNA2_/TRDRNA2_41748_c0_seq1:28-1602(-)